MSSQFTRRKVLSSLAAGVAIMATPAMATRHTSTSASSQINPKEQRIGSLAQQITSGERSDRGRAIAVQRWVRDEVRFGLPASFYETTDLEVLEDRVGYCNTKVLLFCSLLSASGVPYRIRFVDLSSSVLRGLFSPGTSYVDHAITEVGLDGHWIATDSYIVDPALESAARVRLSDEGDVVGYGIHSGGTSEWDGRVAAFIQAVPGIGPPGYIASEHGLFRDPIDFYARVSAARNRKTIVSGLAIRIGAASINRRIDKFRQGK